VDLHYDGLRQLLDVLPLERVARGELRGKLVLAVG